jgi:hypothetical protein
VDLVKCRSFALHAGSSRQVESGTRWSPTPRATRHDRHEFLAALILQLVNLNMTPSVDWVASHLTNGASLRLTLEPRPPHRSAPTKVPCFCAAFENRSKGRCCSRTPVPACF